MWPFHRHEWEVEKEKDFSGGDFIVLYKCKSCGKTKGRILRITGESRVCPSWLSMYIDYRKNQK